MAKRTTLDSALAAFVQVPPHFGPAAADSHAEGGEKLRSDLQAVSESNNRYFVICVILLLILFAGACALVACSFLRPGEITAVFSATGLSFLGILSRMTRLWKEKVNSDLLIALAGNLEPADLRKIANALLKNRLSREKSGRSTRGASPID